MSVISVPQAILDPMRSAVIPCCEALIDLQDKEGRIAGGNAVHARTLSGKLVEGVRRVCGPLDMDGFAEAFAGDMAEWESRGWDSVPDFRGAQAAYSPPQNRGITFFAGPLLCQNGPVPRGKRMEAFLAFRDEPACLEPLYGRFPHPLNACQSARFIAGSRGVRTGNCIVFFPENISTSVKVRGQKYALFFFNKFRRIYREITLPRIRKLFGDSDQFFRSESWVSGEMTPREFYEARCLWGYLHDYYHHRGARPLHLNLQIKLNWYSGLLEETKVDCQTALACMREEPPYAREIFEFILFERMFRYPGQPDSASNFDSGTGVFLFGWLREWGALREEPGGGKGFDLPKALDALQGLVDAVESIERIGDDQAYLDRAREFLEGRMELLPGKVRFRIPEAYARWVGESHHGPLLDFSEPDY